MSIAVDEDLAGGRLDQPQRHHPGRRLARTRLADEPDDLVARQGEVHLAHGVEVERLC